MTCRAIGIGAYLANNEVTLERAFTECTFHIVSFVGGLMCLLYNSGDMSSHRYWSVPGETGSESGAGRELTHHLDRGWGPQ